MFGVALLVLLIVWFSWNFVFVFEILKEVKKTMTTGQRTVPIA